VVKTDANDGGFSFQGMQPRQIPKQLILEELESSTKWKRSIRRTDRSWAFDAMRCAAVVAGATAMAECRGGGEAGAAGGDF